jgi:hypothetical protein
VRCHRLLPALVFLAAIPAAAADPAFAPPIACSIGGDCFVQNYVDADPSPEARDFTCGSLTYDGHKGTDIRLRTYVEMDRGVAVLAAAAGTVLRLRDGMDDVSVAVIGAAAIKDREAGNSVIVDHGGGWVTQYGHMKKGSIAVKVGQQVEAGDRLGEVGLSGNTEFPHLHFEVRHDDRPVDPFTDAAMGASCGGAGHALWAAPVAYVPSGLLAHGFAPTRPDADMARHGAYAGTAPVPSSPALVFWIDMFGLQAGDAATLRLTGPDGAMVAESRSVAAKPKAQYFAFAGKKAPAGGWPAGTYRGAFRIERDGRVIIDDSAEIELH